jgi:hypothetical protein
MEFKGTKGKWVLSIDPLENCNIICGNFYIGESRNKYDALLISKAPEMLEMLKRFVNSDDLDITDFMDAKQLIKEATEL